MNKRVWIILSIIVFVFVGGYFLVNGMHVTPATSQKQAKVPTGPSSQKNVVVPPAASKKITVDGNEYAFSPATFMVHKGQLVTVTFKNSGQYPHNFTISELNVKSATIQPGEETTVTFTPNKTGGYIYICSVPGHADRGMKGALIVQ